MMDGAISLLPLTPVYADVLAAAHARAFARPWLAVDFRQMLETSIVFGRLAVAGEQPAGFALFRAMAGEAEVLTLAVDPDYRRRGIAITLLKACQVEAGTRGAQKVFLEVAESNAAARTLYQALRYETIGCRSGYYLLEDGSRENAVVMGLRLVPEGLAGDRVPPGPDVGSDHPG
ncbi:ribosomal protein S18-alanine N-acetyltransferase [Haematospirillum sp. 15-248]|uniref:ribosomal protein S18-alanine N-acetyltransferase n=1 Tax=Haematospirillum sp. 15-248 TaxID=2723107 RepID=UPI001ADE9874|nr:ribosomal protein S18-alanine N-acetyltransferase [Haematospirillum sp. 15-248]